MMPTAKRALLCAASAAAAAAVLAGAASAQERERRSVIETVTDEIVVTATKSADPENVQDVPIAMTAFGQDTLDALNVRDIEDLSFTTPNVSLDDIGTSRGTANFAIRGLGVNSSIPSIDPAVGVFVDGVYLGVNTGVVFDVFDLESVEVLRGPQGLLFGRNTTGGAVLLNTGNPTDEFEARFRAAVEGPVDSGRGTTNNYVMGTVSGPIVPGTLNGKVAAYYNKDNGYFLNQATGDEFGLATTYIVRGALEFMPTDNFELLGKLEYFDSDGQGPAAQNRGLFDRDSFDFAIDEEGDYKLETWNGSLTAELDLGAVQITNIFGYRDSEGSTLGDIDSSPRFLFHSRTGLEQDQISNEFRVNGRFGRADVTTGLYYFQQDVAYDEDRQLFRDNPFLDLGAGLLPPGPNVIPGLIAANPALAGPLGGLRPVTLFGGEQEHTVYGVFGQVDFEVSENLTATFGLRYSYEEKDASVAYIRPRAPCSVIEGTCAVEGENAVLAGLGVSENNGFEDEDSWENITPKFGLTYESGGQLAYVQYTKGFRSGGYNFRITDVGVFEGNVLDAQDGDFAFDEEAVDAYEIGAKFQSEDRRKTVNVALFRTDIEDFQREVNLADPGAGVVQNITNTADARILGFEIDGQLVVTDSLLLTGNVGVIDAEYEEVRFDLTGDGVVTVADEDLSIPRVPESTYGFGAIYDLDLGASGGLVTRVNFQHRDEIAYTDNNLGFIQAADMLMANVTWQTPKDGLEVSIYGQNLLDEVQAGNDTQLPSVFGNTFSTGQATPFGNRPQGGTLSPLKKGRVLGIELTYEM